MLMMQGPCPVLVSMQHLDSSQPGQQVASRHPSPTHTCPNVRTSIFNTLVRELEGCIRLELGQGPVLVLGVESGVHHDHLH